jgi:hypothetical protein
MLVFGTPCFYVSKIPVPEIIDPVFAKTSQNARFLLSENERFGLVFVKTGSKNSGTALCSAGAHRLCKVALFLPYVSNYRATRTVNDLADAVSRGGLVYNSTQSGNGHFLAYIHHDGKKTAQPGVGEGCIPSPIHSIYHHEQSCGPRSS